MSVVSRATRSENVRRGTCNSNEPVFTIFSGLPASPVAGLLGSGALDEGAPGLGVVARPAAMTVVALDFSVVPLPDASLAAGPATPAWRVAALSSPPLRPMLPITKARTTAAATPARTSGTLRALSAPLACLAQDTLGRGSQCGGWSCSRIA